MPSAASRSAAREGLVDRDARTDERHVVALAEGLRPADREVLLRSVEDGGGLPRRAEVGDAAEVGHRGHEPDRGVAVRGIQDGRPVDRAEGGEVFERHLRGAVLADRHPGVRSAQAEIRPADRRHADLVVGAREERPERRGEGGLAERVQARLRRRSSSARRCTSGRSVPGRRPRRPRCRWSSRPRRRGRRGRRARPRATAGSLRTPCGWRSARCRSGAGAPAGETRVHPASTARASAA